MTLDNKYVLSHYMFKITEWVLCNLHFRNSQAETHHAAGGTLCSRRAGTDSDIILMKLHAYQKARRDCYNPVTVPVSKAPKKITNALRGQNVWLPCKDFHNYTCKIRISKGGSIRAKGEHFLLLGGKRSQSLHCSSSSQSFINQQKNKDPINFQRENSLITLRWAGERVPSAKHLLCKHWGLEFRSLHLWKKSVCTFNPSPEREG